MMRVLLDTNLFISYLLSRNPTSSAMGAILRAAVLGHLVLLFPVDVGKEIRDTVTHRLDLSAKIPLANLDELLTLVDGVAERLPPLQDVLPRVVRDPKDDYLIAHAVLAGADVLVGWDKDLRDLGEVAGVRIASPTELLEVLRARELEA